MDIRQAVEVVDRLTYDQDVTQHLSIDEVEGIGLLLEIGKAVADADVSWEDDEGGASGRASFPREHGVLKLDMFMNGDDPGHDAAFFAKEGPRGGVSGISVLKPEEVFALGAKCLALGLKYREYEKRTKKEVAGAE